MSFVGWKKGYRDLISREKQLPDEYLIAILHFRDLYALFLPPASYTNWSNRLQIGYLNPIHYLQNIQSSPPLRQHFTREPQDASINILTRPRLQ